MRAASLAGRRARHLAALPDTSSRGSRAPPRSVTRPVGRAAAAAGGLAALSAPQPDALRYPHLGRTRLAHLDELISLSAPRLVAFRYPHLARARSGVRTPTAARTGHIMRRPPARKTKPRPKRPRLHIRNVCPRYRSHIRPSAKIYAPAPRDFAHGRPAAPARDTRLRRRRNTAADEAAATRSLGPDKANPLPGFALHKKLIPRRRPRGSRPADPSPEIMRC